MAPNTINLDAMGLASRKASRMLAKLPDKTRNSALLSLADLLEASSEIIIEANDIDRAESSGQGLSEHMLDRLILTAERIKDMAQGVREVASLPDPLGIHRDSHTLPNGLWVQKRSVPLGVIASIYESRPNITVDIASLAVKSGNAVILRGGKEAFNTNKALVALIKKAFTSSGLPREGVQLIESTDRKLVGELLRMRDYIDLMIPRGGESLIQEVREKAYMPVITGGIGVCHTYIDKDANIEKAKAIVYNAKVQRPTVCNALDTILIHCDVLETHLPIIASELDKASVELHCDKQSQAVLSELTSLNTIPATESDWGKEYLSLTAAVRVVSSLEEAVDHIELYGSGHSEAIITEDHSTAMQFLDEVDAAVVYVNASTRFTDGGQFGLGAEIAISTNKLHARGPMGISELTSYKWIVLGNGQVRD